MNKKQLVNLGVSKDSADIAITCIKRAAGAGFFRGKTVRRVITDVIDNPINFIQDEHFSDFAKSLEKKEEPYTPPEPLPFPIWGEDGIDENAIKQMNVACQLPITVGGACMADAHLGYGLPIGGVLATENAVIPYAVGVDIACRVKLSVLDVPINKFDKDQEKYEKALEHGTKFGVGAQWKPRFSHEVMDKDWKVSEVTNGMKDRAWDQLGTSGGGNHFVEWGILTLHTPELGLEAGKYLALMSHSGSRGTGAAVCSFYDKVAKSKLEKKYQEYFKSLAWLPMDTQEGFEYWQAMNLMGEYAAANHACIHYMVSKLAGAEIIAGVENHHNFAWKEMHNGKELIVHRKGATPAGEGVLGVIPGSMADPAYVVRGKGVESSFKSASHGAGRRMSRKAAMSAMNWNHWKGVLRQRGVKLISAGLDEMPGVYKSIVEVMAAQSDLVSIVAEFFPRIVKMADDGTAED